MRLVLSATILFFVPSGTVTGAMPSFEICSVRVAIGDGADQLIGRLSRQGCRVSERRDEPGVFTISTGGGDRSSLGNMLKDFTILGTLRFNRGRLVWASRAWDAPENSGRYRYWPALYAAVSEAFGPDDSHAAVEVEQAPLNIGGNVVPRGYIRILCRLRGRGIELVRVDIPTEGPPGREYMIDELIFVPSK